MTGPVEPRTRKGSPTHDVSHLHALWKREGANALAMAPPGLSVAQVADGLICRSEGREVGRLTVRDGAVIASPPFATPTVFADRLTPPELAGWLISAAARLP